MGQVGNTELARAAASEAEDDVVGVDNRARLLRAYRLHVHDEVGGGESALRERAILDVEVLDVVVGESAEPPCEVLEPDPLGGPVPA